MWSFAWHLRYVNSIAIVTGALSTSYRTKIIISCKGVNQNFLLEKRFALSHPQRIASSFSIAGNAFDLISSLRYNTIIKIWFCYPIITITKGIHGIDTIETIIGLVCKVTWLQDTYTYFLNIGKNVWGWSNIKNK